MLDKLFLKHFAEFINVSGKITTFILDGENNNIKVDVWWLTRLDRALFLTIYNKTSLSNN